MKVEGHFVQRLIWRQRWRLVDRSNKDILKVKFAFEQSIKPMTDIWEVFANFHSHQ